jgi:8-oxo-dGTP diphosphatase
LLVRHAKAGSRYRFEGPDSERPLTEKGLAQARRLAAILSGMPRPVRRAVSSPAARCRQTIEPLAAASGVAVDDVDWLSEGAEPLPAFDELRRMAYESDAADGSGGPVAACSHGDVIWGVLDRLARDGVDLGEQPDAPKGGVWVISFASEEERPDAVATARLVRLEEAR